METFLGKCTVCVVQDGTQFGELLVNTGLDSPHESKSPVQLSRTQRRETETIRKCVTQLNVVTQHSTITNSVRCLLPLHLTNLLTPLHDIIAVALSVHECAAGTVARGFEQKYLPGRSSRCECEAQLL